MTNSKIQKIKQFNPNDVGKTTNNIFGLPFTIDESEIVIIPVPWDISVSNKPGTANGPSAILSASFQVDLYDPDFPDLWKLGIAVKNISNEWLVKNNKLRPDVDEYIEFLGEGNNLSDDEEMQKICSQANEACKELKDWVKSESLHYLKKGKMVAVIGGEHSVFLGLLQALLERYNDIGILQIDAHMDLRKAYENLEFSHASVMYNALKFNQVSKLVQVGVRDYCEEEIKSVINYKDRISVFTDAQIKQELFAGKVWKDICHEIVEELPDNVYVSFDIDGLDPSLCPNTGTPVPGGLRFEEANYLFSTLVDSGRKIVGFDLCEVASGNALIDNHQGIDENTGARLLYKLCGWMARSNNKLHGVST